MYDLELNKRLENAVCTYKVIEMNVKNLEF